MSSQDSTYPSFPFTISTPFRPIRLLEVPDDLLSVLTNTNNGSGSTRPTLKFKSAPTATSSSSTTRAPTAKEGILHLCTDDKAWAVKQVSTSNSVYLIRPLQGSNLDLKRNGNDNDEMQDVDDTTQLPSTSIIPIISAVSQASNFLELHPVRSDIPTIEAAITDLVPVYHMDSSGDGEDTNLDLISWNNSKTAMTLVGVIDSIPAPDTLVRQVLARLAAFESSWPSGNDTVNDSHLDGPRTGKKRCMIPSTATLLSTWRNVIESCTIEDMRLDVPIKPTTITKTLSSPIDQAIAQSLFDPEGTLSSLGISDTPTTNNTLNLNPERTCRFTAGLLLTTTRESNLSTFLSAWTDLVPSRFMKFCTVDTLKHLPGVTITGSESDVDLNIVRWTPISKSRITGVADVNFTFVLETFVQDGGGDVSGNGNSIGRIAGSSGNGGGGGSSTVGEPKSVVVDKKRKWHEKFGAQRDRDREREGGRR